MALNVCDEGCVEVVGCLRGEELAAWDRMPEGVCELPF